MDLDAREPTGVLKGTRLGPRRIAALAHGAGFRDADLFTAVAVCGAESWFYSKASNDNKALMTDLKDGQTVLNVETYEKVVVVDAETGKIRLSDFSIVKVPLTTTWITSRDVGLMEINIAASLVGTSVEANLYEPERNFAQAFTMWQSRGWQPWVAFTSNVYLHDTYVQWALLGVANWWGEHAKELATAAGVTQKTRVPWVSLKNLRVIYPDVQLG